MEESEQVAFTVTLDYGDEGPGEGENIPGGEEIARWIMEGMARHGWTSVDVSAKCQQ